MIPGVSNWLSIPVAILVYTLFGVPCWLLWFWLKKHPRSGICTAITIGSASVIVGAVLARFHNWLAIAICLIISTCVYADWRKRHGRELFPRG